MLELLWRSVREFEEIIEKKVREQLELIEVVRRVCFETSLKCGGVFASILYGSLARLEFGEGSDIDVLFIVKDKNVEKCLVNELSGKEPYINFLTFTLGEWKEVKEAFRFEVINNGIILYASGISINELLQSKPYILLEYSLKDLTPAERSRFTYLVSGARVKSHGKYYRSKSFLNKLGGMKLGERVILVPYEQAEKLMNKLPAKIKITKKHYVLCTTCKE